MFTEWVHRLFRRGEALHNKTTLLDLPLLCLEHILRMCKHRVRFARLVCKRMRDAADGLRWLDVSVDTELELKRLMQNTRAVRHLYALNIRSGLQPFDVRGDTILLRTTFCCRMSDVSALAGIHTLYMCDCANVTNVDALAGIHTLNMCGCTGVTDVGALVGAKSLVVNESQLSSLRGVDTLQRAGCRVIVW